MRTLSERTGWSFSVLAGGPHPKANGNISVARYGLSYVFQALNRTETRTEISFHIGENALGVKFGDTAKFDDSMMKPYSAFLEDVYRKFLITVRLFLLMCSF